MRFPDVGKAGPAAANVFKIVNRKPLIDSSSSEGSQLSQVKGSVEFRNVTFAYPSRKEVLVFRHFNLEVPAGKKIALVGSSNAKLCICKCVFC